MDIYATNSLGESESPSSLYEIVVESTDTSPATPSNVTAQPDGAALAVFWSPSSGATSYEVSVSLNVEPYTDIRNVELGEFATNTYFGELNSNTQYRVAVVAKNAEGSALLDFSL